MESFGGEQALDIDLLPICGVLRAHSGRLQDGGEGDHHCRQNDEESERVWQQIADPLDPAQEADDDAPALRSVL